ncbi:hypothetical protein F4805DRAFT_216630 [Annulohypoxylon moriforme]|nr:hypothetical protein F4805DRAFT_216630 [Annulohypoxylon moriforme]
MSSQPKITSKNLSYSNDLPPFLAKLRGQQEHHRNSDSPDPILAARRRAARPRSASEEAEDAPLVVDEAGNTIAFPSAADAQKTIDGVIDGKDGGGADNGDKDENGKEREREKVAGIGASKKRKVGRVVGGDEEEEPTDTNANAPPKTRTEKENSSKSKDKKDTKNTSDANSKDAKSSSKQGKKKAKKIKLSFGDDGD